MDVQIFWYSGPLRGHMRSFHIVHKINLIVTTWNENSYYALSFYRPKIILDPSKLFWTRPKTTFHYWTSHFERYKKPFLIDRYFDLSTAKWIFLFNQVENFEIEKKNFKTFFLQNFFNSGKKNLYISFYNSLCNNELKKNKKIFFWQN